MKFYVDRTGAFKDETHVKRLPDRLAQPEDLEADVVDLTVPEAA